MALKPKTKKSIVDLSFNNRKLAKKNRKLAKKIVAFLNDETEEQKLLNEANAVYQRLQNKNFDKEEVSAVLDIVKVLNELYGF